MPVALLIWFLGTVAAWHGDAMGNGWWPALRRTAQPLESEPRAKLLDQVRESLGTDRLPPLATSASLDRPVMIGLLRPLVILPADVLEKLPEPELIDVLVHECRPRRLPPPSGGTVAAAGGDVVLASSAGASLEPGIGPGPRGSV